MKWNAKHNFIDGLYHRIVAMNVGSWRSWEVIINKNNYHIGNLRFFSAWSHGVIPCSRNSSSSRQQPRVAVREWEQVVQFLRDYARRFHLYTNLNPKFKCFVQVLNAWVRYTTTTHFFFFFFLNFFYKKLKSLIRFMWETVLTLKEVGKFNYSKINQSVGQILMPLLFSKLLDLNYLEI